MKLFVTGGGIRGIASLFLTNSIPRVPIFYRCAHSQYSTPPIISQGKQQVRGKLRDMSAPKAPKFIAVAPKGTHSATVIFIHGLGDSGKGWLSLITEYAANPALQHVKWILPNAPFMAVTANRGAVMPSWYDIKAFGAALESEDDEKGLLHSAGSIQELVAAEVNSGISADRVVVGGFSQGGTLSLLIGLTTAYTLAGIVVLSGRLTLKNKIKDVLSPHVLSLPIFWGHGKSDPMVKYDLGLASADFLKNEIGIKTVEAPNPATRTPGLDFHAYDGLTHSVSEEEVEDLKQWLSKVIPSQ